MPAGLSLSGSGTISGTPTALGLSCFRVRATGADGLATDKDLVLTISGPPTITTSSPLPVGTVGAAYSQTLTASGGTTPYSWSLVAGSLPSGLSLSSAGVISGTPDTVAVNSFTVQVTGSDGLSATADFSLTITPTPQPMTNVISGVTVNYPDTYMIGSNNGFNGLIVTNAGVLTSGGGVIGNSAVSSTNFALVTGAGSLWSNSGSLFIGSTGSFNQLIITNGGQVIDSNGFVGNNNISSSNNTVVVAGTGSVWSNSAFIVMGGTGAFNRMTIANGGKAYDTGSYIGSGPNSSNNVVTVTGAGSYWSNNVILAIGGNGTFNQLIITNGGVVYSGSGYVGNNPAARDNVAVVTGTGSVWNSGSILYVGDTSGGNQLNVYNGGAVYSTTGYVGYSSSATNVALVTGAGSLWSNSSLIVGNNGSGNNLMISNGGTVSATNLLVGASSYSTGNVIAVSGGNLYATNTTRNGALNVNYGALNLNSGTVTANRLLAANGANSVVNFNGGTLNSGGSTVNNGLIFRVGNGTSAATLDLLGGAHSFANGLLINTNATLTGTGAITGSITDAGLIAPGNGLGVITDTGSLTMLGGGAMTLELGGTNAWLYDQFDLTGAITFGGTLTVSLVNGYAPQAGDQFNLFDFGSSGGAFSQTNLPTLGGSLFWNTSLLYSSGVIFADSNSTSSLTNVVVINGVTSNYPGTYMVGVSSGFNGLIVTNAGILTSGGGVIGNSANATNNAALVTGAGSLWSNSGTFYVGATGSFNQLTIANGGCVTNTDGYIGYNATAGNNAAFVTGAGSIWNNSGGLYVGNGGASNSLILASGGTVTATNVVIGSKPSTGNFITVSGGNLYATNATGNAALNVNYGALNLNSGTVAVNQFIVTNGASSVVNFNGGTLNSGGSTVNNGALFQVGNGTSAATFDLLGGAHSFANGLFINTNATLTGTGAITGSITDAGLIGPGNGLGVITDSGNLTMLGSGTMAMELGGTNAWLYDQFDLTGALTFGGTLTVSLLNGYTPQAGDRFDLFDFGSSGGAFSQINLPGLASQLHWDTSLLYSSGVIFVDTNGASSLTNIVVINGVTSNYAGTYMVGSTGGFNGLIVTNAGILTSAGGVIGNSALASNNFALVTGAGSLWSNSGSLYIGSTGSFNQLTITNGGRVTDSSGYLGYATGSSNNTVSVTGAGSIWSNNSTLAVGVNGAGNQLTIANGGVVYVPNVFVGQASGSSNNTVVVTGAGSLWNNSTYFNIGSNGSFNQLTIANSGKVYGLGCYIGSGTTSSNNLVTVSGAGSYWSNNVILVIGGNGTFNQMIITNGGVVYSALGYIGNNSTARDNAALVTGTGSVWNSGSILYVGDTSAGNQLNVANGGAVFSATGYVGYSGSSTNVALVTGAGSLWSNSSLIVGNNGSGNSLMISNGGTVSATNLVVGASSSSTGNVIAVSGGNLYATNTAGSGALNINYGALNLNSGTVTVNRFLVTNGANSAVNFNGGTLNSGGSFVSNGLALVVGNTGTGATLNLLGGSHLFANGVTVGNAGVANGLVVAKGAVARSLGNTILGNTGSGTNNTLLVTDSGSLWSNSGSLYVGYSGAVSSLIITNGGMLYDMTGYVGNVSSSSNNTVLVSGTNSLWKNNSDLYVGYQSSGNQMIINSGAVVSNAAGSIGNYMATGIQNNNSVLVDGAGSAWISTNGPFLMARRGSSNSLTIRNGGLVSAPGFQAGTEAEGDNNYVTIDGTNSRLITTSADFLFGGFGYGNVLLITNGGAVMSGSNSWFGMQSSGQNNRATVTGDGSAWTSVGYLTVGWSGSGNTLAVANGGLLSDAVGYVGSNSSANNNAVLVTGTGSTWSNSASLYVGWSGSGNTLTSANGGAVTATNIVIGYASSSGNLITVAGGSLYATNATGGGALNVNYGTFNLNSGTVTVNRLIATNGANSVVNFNGGTLTSSGTIISNGTQFVVGNGSSVATMKLVGGTNVFASGLMIAANASVTNMATLIAPSMVVNAAGLFAMTGGLAAVNVVTNAGTFSFRGGSFNLTSFDNTGLFEVWNNLTVGPAASLANRDGGDVRLVSNATVNVSGSLVITNATLEFAGASTAATPFLPGVTFQNASVIKWAGYGGSFGNHAITGDLDLDLPSGPGLMRGIVDNASLTIGGGNGQLSVGSNNPFSLTVTNGGQVINGDGWVGCTAASSNSTVLVTGAGSLWSNAGVLTIGQGAPGNQVTLANGGQIDAVVFSNFSGSIFSMSGGSAVFPLVYNAGTISQTGGEQDVTYGTNSGVWTVASGGLLEVRNNLTISPAGGLTNYDGGNVRLVSNATVNVSGSLVITNATLEFAGASVLATPFLPGITFQNASAIKWAGYGGSFGTHVITGNLNLDLPSGPGLMRGIVDNSSLTVGSGSGLLYVGSNNLDSLTITNGGRVVNYAGFVGYTALSSNNSVFVSGSGSLWSNASDLVIGVSGSGNQMTINNGAQVLSDNGNAGFFDGASNNVVLVSGAGSVWSNSSDFWMGVFGSGNQLTITNGGRVVNGNGYVGAMAGANSNAVWVSGAGSVWSNSADLYVSEDNNWGNSVTIANGGQVVSANGHIGAFSSGSSNNWVMVTGAGSLWRNTANLDVGETGPGNLLTISNGGIVSATNIVVGAIPSSTGNVVTVSGGYLYATNSAGGGAINVLYGTLNLNSGTVAVDRLLLTNFANSVFNLNGGVLQAGQVFSSQPLTVNGGTLSLAGSFVNLSGGTFQLNSGGVIVPGSVNNQGMFIQNGGLFDPLVFTNSGTFILNSGTNMDGVFLNLASGTVSQTAGEHDVNVATNYGSWTISGGVANLTNLVIDGGGVFTNAGGLLVSTNASGTGGMGVHNGTLALISGTVTVNQFFATNGANSVISFNGGTLNSGGTIINNGAAFTVGDTGNGAALNLVGGTHSFNNNLVVGNSGAGNSLLITNGAQALVKGGGIIGNAASSSNNSVSVTGTGSTWSNINDLYVGKSGAANNLTISNGGLVANANGYIGYASSANSNTVTVTGAGSVWNNGYLDLGGYGGAANRLTISSGGTVSDYSGYIGYGYYYDTSNNMALVTGAGSLWSNGASLFVGYRASGNYLTITNGGMASDADGYIAFLSGNNAAVVAGPGSLWSNSGSFYVGYIGSSNQLTIANGGAVNDADGNVGYLFSVSNNLAVVTGGGSVWSNSASLSVGNASSFNQLTITNGGMVFSAIGYVGNGSSATNNSAWVAGAGSAWNNSASLNVGTGGASNNLIITSGGMVTATNIVIGSSPAAGNVITVSNGWLYATNTTGNGALNAAYGTLNLISGTVTVNHLYVTNGANSVVSFNGGTLNSGGSMVNNGVLFQVGNGVTAATLDLFGGTHSFANDLFINTNAILTGTGAITGSITDAGLIAPGNGFGVITDTGSLTMLGGGAMTMELGGTNAWLYDRFDLTGTLSFGGTLTVALLNGYTPHAGDQFNLFDFGSSSGVFSLTNLPTLSPTLYWNTSALYSSGVIEADQATGSLQVTLAPQAAIDAGAKWQVDTDGNWHTNNETVGGLLVGSHTLSYTNLTGWIAPTNQTVQIATGVTTTNNGTYQLTPLLLAAVSRKTQGGAGTFDLNLNLNGTPTATVEPRLSGPTQLLFTFNKAMAAADGTLDATEFTLTNATFVSASIVSSNLTLNLTNVVDQSKVTVVMNGLTDLAGNALSGTNAVLVRSLCGDVNQSGTVNAVDMQQVKNNLLTTVTSVNFLSDVNCSGNINAVDLQQIKNNLLHSASLVADSGDSTPSTLSDSLTTSGLATITLGQALGATNLTWSTDGDAPWTATVAEDGSQAAWSGSIGNLNVSWVETTVTGPGTLSFDWMVSSELSGDYLTFAIDGVNQPGTISGEVGWQTLTFNIPAGTHRLTWTYSKNGATAAGLDAGWLRRVVYR